MNDVIEKCLNDIRLEIAAKVVDFQDSLIDTGVCVIHQCDMCGEHVTRVRFPEFKGVNDTAFEYMRLPSASGHTHQCDAGTAGVLSLIGVVSLKTGQEEE